MNKRLAIALGSLQTITAIGALPAGLSMIFDPSGNGIGMSPELLAGSPFSSFLIPGVFLFVVNGIFNAAGAVLSFIKNKYAGIAGLSLGIALILWICVQVYFLGLSFFLQPLFFIVGATEVFLGYKLMRQVP